VSNGASASHGAVESRIPSRMDRLPWARWHWLVVFALGITWILDGLEVTIVGNIAGRLAEPDSGLNLTEGQIGLAAGIYIAGACTGALFFSYLTDKYGRKRFFLITLGVYLVFSFLTGFSWNFWSFAFYRFIAGPVIFGNVIGTGSVFNLFIAYLFSAGLMIFAAVVEVFLGVRAEGQSLENVARPLTAIEESTGTSAAARA